MSTLTTLGSFDFTGMVGTTASAGNTSASQIPASITFPPFSGAATTTGNTGQPHLLISSQAGGTGPVAGHRNRTIINADAYPPHERWRVPLLQHLSQLTRGGLPMFTCEKDDGSGDLIYTDMWNNIITHFMAKISRLVRTPFSKEEFIKTVMRKADDVLLAEAANCCGLIFSAIVVDEKQQSTQYMEPSVKQTHWKKVEIAIVQFCINAAASGLLPPLDFYLEF